MRRSHEGLRGIIKDHYLNLPKELEEFNYYYCDGDTGHVIMAIPECLLEEAEKIGCKTINGLGMMLYQGAASFKLWTDQDMPIDVVKEALDF